MTLQPHPKVEEAYVNNGVLRRISAEDAVMNHVLRRLERAVAEQENNGAALRDQACLEETQEEEILQPLQIALQITQVLFVAIPL